MPYHTTFDPTTRLWSGPADQPFYSPNASVATVALAGLALNPGHIAQISDSDGSRMTNGELRQLAVRIALNLRHVEDVQHGDVISVVANNHRLVAPALLGSIAVAAPVNFLHVNFKRDEYVHMFRITRPKVIFCDAHLVSILREALNVLGTGSVALYTMDRQVDDAKFIEDLIVPSSVPDAEELFQATSVGDGTKHAALIVCSSGTTGLPKGVSISHAVLLHQILSSAGNFTPNGKVLIVSLFWVSSIAIQLATFVFGVTRVITAAEFGPEMIVRMVEQYGITSAVLTPLFLVQIARSPLATPHKLRTLRGLFWAGGGLPVDLVPLCDRVYPVPVRGVYGLTELGGIVTCSTLAAVRAGSAGRLGSGMSVQLLRDLGDDGHQIGEASKVADARCGPGEVGEISIRSSLPVLGYWGDEAASVAAVSPEGWFKTGDIGYFDEDGNLFIVDRKKEILKCRYVNVSPSELEEVVRQLPGVADVCVVGVPDEMPGTDMPAAVVVRKEGEDGQRLRVEDVKAIVEDRLSAAKALRGGVWFVGQMPMTPSGKLLRRQVKEWVLKWRAEETL